MTIDELQKELKKVADNKKGYEIDNNYLEAQIKNKRTMLDTLEAQVKVLESKRLGLEESIKSEYAHLLKEIEDKLKSARENNSLAIEFVEKAKMDNGVLQDRISQVESKIKENDSLKTELIRKLGKLKELAKEIG